LRRFLRCGNISGPRFAGIIAGFYDLGRMAFAPQYCGPRATVRGPWSCGPAALLPLCNGGVALAPRGFCATVVCPARHALRPCGPAALLALVTRGPSGLGPQARDHLGRGPLTCAEGTQFEGRRPERRGTRPPIQGPKDRGSSILRKALIFLGFLTQATLLSGLGR
jgi:hypothetical protein